MPNVYILPTWVDPQYEDFNRQASQSITSSVILLDYEVPASQMIHLTSIHVSADAEVNFTISINGSPLRILRTSVEQRSVDINFGAGWKKLSSGASLRVTVEPDEIGVTPVFVFTSLDGFKETLP